MSVALRAAAFVLAAGMAGFAIAQARIVAIPAEARRATMTFQGTPEVILDNQAARLSPGARVFDRGNYLQMYGAINGTFKVKYLLEATTGLVQTVWILTDTEIATPDPKPPQ